MNTTKIEWTDMSVNPMRLGRGHYCEKISAGCANCYASRLQPRFGNKPFGGHRANATRPTVTLDAGRLNAVMRRRKPTRIFWCDMSDMFGEWVTDEQIAACFGVMAATPQHTHLVLTKRAERMRDWVVAHGSEVTCEWLAFKSIGHGRLAAYVCGLGARWEPEQIGDEGRVELPGYFEGVEIPWPLPNVHLGVSVEDQRAADERIPLLLDTPAAVRWISAEPLLGPVDLAPWLRPRYPSFGSMGGGSGMETLAQEAWERSWGIPGTRSERHGLDWVVVGGESGPGARPCDVAWIRSIVGQCREAGVACFVKQLGTRPVVQHPTEPGALIAAWCTDPKGGDPDEWPEDLRVRQQPNTDPGLHVSDLP